MCMCMYIYVYVLCLIYVHYYDLLVAYYLNFVIKLGWLMHLVILISNHHKFAKQLTRLNRWKTTEFEVSNKD